MTGITMKAITIIQAAVLAMLAVYGASAGADHTTLCHGKPEPAAQSCKL
ncbi:hypothetical protein [Tropicibacter sp. S64]